MTEIVKIFVEVINRCENEIDAHFLTVQEHNETENIINEIKKSSDKFTHIIESKDTLTKNELIQLNNYLITIIKNLKNLHNLLPKVSKRHFAIVENAK